MRLECQVVGLWLASLVDPSIVRVSIEWWEPNSYKINKMSHKIVWDWFFFFKFEKEEEEKGTDEGGTG